MPTLHENNFHIISHILTPCIVHVPPAQNVTVIQIIINHKFQRKHLAKCKGSQIRPKKISWQEGPKQCCKDLCRRLCVQDLLDRFSVEAAVPSPFEVGHLLKFKLSKNISEKDLCSPHTVFGQDPFNRSLSKISAYKDLVKNVEISFVPQMKDLSSTIHHHNIVARYPLCDGLCRRLRARSP